MLRSRACVVLGAAIVLSATACRRTVEPDPGFVAVWTKTLYGAIRVERLSPPVASRLMAYASMALYSGLTVADPTERPFAGSLNGLGNLPKADPRRRYDATLIAVAAERLVLDSLFREGLPTTRSSLAQLADSLSADRVAKGANADLVASSDSLGRAIGSAIISWAKSDGFEASRGRTYTPPVGAGMWVNDAPATVYAAQNLSGASQLIVLNNPANTAQAGNVSDRGLILDRPKSASNKTLPAVNMAGESEPYWGTLRPFVLKAYDECPLAPPPSYSTDTSSALYREAVSVRDLMLKSPPPRLAVSTDVETQTRWEREAAEKRSVALYWADNAGESGTPPGHWASIASQLASQRRLSATDAARVLTVSSIAQADAFIAAWGYKYHYTLIRPRTYIRRVIDRSWEPAIPTPPFPEYPSAHSTQSAAAAEVLSSLIGDTVAFADSTGLSIGNPVRHFQSFRNAAEEAGMSRIYGGIHFPYGNVGGRDLGQCIGRTVLDRLGPSVTGAR